MSPSRLFLDGVGLGIYFLDASNDVSAVTGWSYHLLLACRPQNIPPPQAHGRHGGLAELQSAQAVLPPAPPANSYPFTPLQPACFSPPSMGTWPMWWPAWLSCSRGRSRPT